jgi:CRISPR-associated endonuclease/helicase Cas3
MRSRPRVTIYLEAGWEKVTPKAPFASFTQPLLYHQVRTLEALKRHDLVLNSYNTGTGKTVASLLYLFELNGQGKNVLFIAPTNALIGQHTEDIQQFVAAHHLDFKVLRVTAADVRALETLQRPGETLQRLIKNYLEFETAAVRRQPIILVVNPDIFYYALYFRYGAHDRRNVFQEFLSRFDYIVVDEFHYYDYKQVANFLFAFALFDQLGYFEVRGRKICLLSATPGEAVKQYLDQLFGPRWVHIGPNNEPAESEAYERTPTLTPLELRLETGSLRDWVNKHPAQLTGREQDGAIISSSLAQINEAYHLLRRSVAETEMGRITGPERPEDRLAATARRLILATPTVDIGYNFVKKGKSRQNVDFVIFDARYGDELLQRLGRAGRVLGKPETTRLSQAVAVLSPEAVGALAGLEGQTLSRAEFSRQVAGCEALPPKHNLTAYIRTYAIVESFAPIYEFGRMLPPALESEVDGLFERVRSLFAPHSRRSRRGLTGFFRKVEARRRWLAQKQLKLDKETASHVADWLTWLRSIEEQVTPGQIQAEDLAYLLADRAQQQALRDFVESQLAVTEALFAFRDSFQGPTAVIYDPHTLLSSQIFNRYDLFHLIRHYKLSPPLTRRQFEQLSGSTDLAGDFYFQLLAFREVRLQLGLVYESEDERAVFERKWVGAPVGLKGLHLQVREQQGDILAGALDEAVVTAVAEKALPMLIIPPDSVGATIARLRGTNLWSYNLTVHFEDGTVDEGYKALLGVAAFMGYAELQGHFLMRERLKPEVIII